ncbi:hypothetical protein ABPG72_004077 [Tetrahymena utriculariae]
MNSEQLTSKLNWKLNELLDLLFKEELENDGVRVSQSQEIYQNKENQFTSSGSNFIYSQYTANFKNIYDYFIFCYITVFSEDEMFNKILEYFKQNGTKVHIRIIVFLELWITHNSTVIKYDEGVQGSFLNMLIEICKSECIKTKWMQTQLENILKRFEEVLASNIDDEENFQFNLVIKRIKSDCVLDKYVEKVYEIMQKEQIIILAQQICLYEQFLLFQLDNRTILNHKKYPNKFTAPLIQFFDCLSNFSCVLVYFSSLYEPGQSLFKSRVTIIEQIISLAFQLKLYNNFSSSYSLYLSIQTTKFLFPGMIDYINIISQRKLKKLDVCFSNQVNLALLQNNSPLPAVPYIGISLSQIARMNEFHRDYNGTFNFKRLEEQTTILKNLDQFKHFKYDFELQPQIYQYLQCIPKIDATKVISSFK